MLESLARDSDDFIDQMSVIYWTTTVLSSSDLSDL